jgi:Na+-driven multidrug efflux pump
MVAIKKVNINLIKTAICSSLNIVLNIILIRQFGSLGAAYATVIVSFCSSIFAVSYFVYWIKKQEKNDLRKEEINV